MGVAYMKDKPTSDSFVYAYVEDASGNLVKVSLDTLKDKLGTEKMLTSSVDSNGNVTMSVILKNDETGKTTTAEMKKLQIGDTIYDIADSTARKDINTIKTAGYVTSADLNTILAKYLSTDDNGSIVSFIESTETGIVVHMRDESTVEVPISQAKEFETVDFDNETRYLHFYDSDGNDVFDPVMIEGGGGGGSSSSSVVTLTNQNGVNAMTIPLGGTVVLKFNFTSTESDLPTGDGSCQISVNGSTKTTFNIQQGLTTYDVSQYLISGSNTIRVTCTDVYGNYKTLIYRVSVVEIYVTSTFDATIPYSDDITFKYTAYGSAEKTVHILVDGNEIASSVSTVSGRMVTQIIPKMTHGIHVLDVYITADIDGTEMESPHLKYEVMCVERYNTSPMIAAVCDTTELNEGQQVDIPYIVYDPSALSADITLDIYTMNGSSEEIFNTQSITVDRSQQHWITRKYPIGTVYFRIKYGEINRTFTIEVAESPIKVTPETTDLELQLTAEGRSNNEARPNVWKYNSIDTTFNNFNWHSNGWLTDQNGDTCLRFNGDTTATINFKPFESDIRTHGKTIELEFSARDVNRRDSVIISCLSGGIGFEVTPDGAYIKSEQSTVSCKFKDEKKVKLTFVVEARNLYRQLSLYLNGVLSDIVQYPDSDNFQQKNPVVISIGSPTCAVDIYSIRSYSNGFGSSVAVNNYIADIKDVIERTEAYERNDIYDEYQNVSFEKVKKYNSVMVLVGDLPQSKGDKKKLKVIYTDVDDPSINFTEDDVSADVQGTSSQYYVRKNWKLKFTKNHYIDKTQLPAKMICIKVDYAEATGTHNTQNAIVAETLYSEKIPPQDQDPKCRTTIYGKPILLFHQADENSEPTFYAKANFNYDKGAEHVFGFTSDYDVECWEFCNNTSDACNFLAEVPDDWGDDFEARYPDEYSSIGRFKTMHSWVVSTRKDTATGASLSSTYVGKDGKEYTRDTAEYRLAKFKMEFEDHFNLHYCLIYYVYTFFALMVDQRAKNMFMTYWASKGKWYPYFYDNDTCFGINNEGQLVFDYYHEDTDKLDGANVYNGQNSVLWNNFREAFADEIKAMYQSLRNDKKLTYDKLVDRFVTNGSDKWSESIYNEDSDFKYITMLRTSGDGSNLSQVRGTGEEHLCYMLENRFNYCDSKWYASDYANDYISLRIYTPADGTWSGIAPSPAVTITPFSTMYAGVRYKANGSLLQQKVESGKSVTFGSDLTETFNDTETAIYGAHQISSIGDLAPLYCGSINVSKADKLIELKVGDGTEGYANNNLIDLSVGTNHQMRVIDVQNCPKLNIVLDVSNCSNIEEIYAKGSGITGVSFPDGGVVKKVELPATISNFTIKNQAYIDSITFEGYDNIKTLWVENTPNVDGFDILSKATNVERLRLTDVNLQYDTIDDLVELSKRPIGGIDENGNNVDIMWISGKCHVKELTGAQYAIVKELFPYLTITYTSLTTQLTFKSYDGSVTYTTQTIRNGGNGTDPVSSGAITTPTRESDAQYDFTFAGWSLVQHAYYADSSALNKVEIDRTVYAAFSGFTRSYTVRFFNGTELLQTDIVLYGRSTSYRGETPQNMSTGDPSDFEFKGWSPSPTNITGNTDCYAQYYDLRIITDSWKTIAEHCADGSYKDLYSVGTSKEVLYGMPTYNDAYIYSSAITSDGKIYISSESDVYYYDTDKKTFTSIFADGSAKIEQAYLTVNDDELIITDRGCTMYYTYNSTTIEKIAGMYGFNIGDNVYHAVSNPVHYKGHIYILISRLDLVYLAKIEDNNVTTVADLDYNTTAGTTWSAFYADDFQLIIYNDMIYIFNVSKLDKYMATYSDGSSLTETSLSYMPTRSSYSVFVYKNELWAIAAQQFWQLGDSGFTRVQGITYYENYETSNKRYTVLVKNDEIYIFKSSSSYPLNIQIYDGTDWRTDCVQTMHARVAAKDKDELDIDELHLDKVISSKATNDFLAWGTPTVCIFKSNLYVSMKSGTHILCRTPITYSGDITIVDLPEDVSIMNFNMFVANECLNFVILTSDYDLLHYTYDGAVWGEATIIDQSPETRYYNIVVSDNHDTNTIYVFANARFYKYDSRSRSWTKLDATINGLSDDSRTIMFVYKGKLHCDRYILNDDETSFNIWQDYRSYLRYYDGWTVRSYNASLYYICQPTLSNYIMYNIYDGRGWKYSKPKEIPIRNSTVPVVFCISEGYIYGVSVRVLASSSRSFDVYRLSCPTMTTNTSLIPSAPHGVKRTASKCVVYNHYLYLLGGSNSANSLKFYKLDGETWTNIGTIPETVSRTSKPVIYDNKMYYISTTNKLYCWDSTSWELISWPGSDSDSSSTYLLNYKGDLLIVTTGDFIWYRYNGTEWSSSSFHPLLSSCTAIEVHNDTIYILATVSSPTSAYYNQFTLSAIDIDAEQVRSGITSANITNRDIDTNTLISYNNKLYWFAPINENYNSQYICVVIDDDSQVVYPVDNARASGLYAGQVFVYKGYICTLGNYDYLYGYYLSNGKAPLTFVMDEVVDEFHSSVSTARGTYERSNLHTIANEKILSKMDGVRDVARSVVKTYVGEDDPERTKNETEFYNKNPEYAKLYSVCANMWMLSDNEVGAGDYLLHDVFIDNEATYDIFTDNASRIRVNKDDTNRSYVTRDMAGYFLYYGHRRIDFVLSSGSVDIATAYYKGVQLTNISSTTYSAADFLVGFCV